MSCSNLSIIPQFLDTCWFNTLLMAVLYSQNSRNMLYEITKDWNSRNSNKFQMIILKILKNIYFKSEIDVFEFYSKIKPETILLKLIKTYNLSALKRQFKEKFKKNKCLCYNTYFIYYFYKLLGVKTLDLFILDTDDVYVNCLELSIESKNTTSFELNPDVIIMFHKDLEYIITENISKLNYKKNKIDRSLYDFNELDNYENQIIFNGEIYNLDSCLLSNYNKSEFNHLILNMTCDNDKYIYDGVLNSSNIPCKLIKYDWDLQKTHKNFELDKENCSLRFNNFKNNFKFNLNKGNRILIYVKNKKEKEIQEIYQEVSSVSSSLSNDIDFLLDITTLTEIEINILLIKFKYLFKNLKRNLLEIFTYDDLIYLRNLVDYSDNSIYFKTLVDNYLSYYFLLFPLDVKQKILINIYKNLYSNTAINYDYINQILDDISKLTKTGIIIDMQYYYEKLILSNDNSKYSKDLFKIIPFDLISDEEINKICNIKSLKTREEKINFINKSNKNHLYFKLNNQKLTNYLINLYGKFNLYSNELQKQILTEIKTPIIINNITFDIKSLFIYIFIVNENINLPITIFNFNINNEKLIEIFNYYFNNLSFKEIINTLSNNNSFKSYLPSDINKYTDKSISLIRNNLLEFLYLIYGETQKDFFLFIEIFKLNTHYDLSITKINTIIKYFYGTSDIIKIITEIIDKADESIIYKLANIYNLNIDILTSRDDFIDIYYKSNDKDYVLNQLLLVSGVSEDSLNTHRRKLHDDYKKLYKEKYKTIDNYLNYFDVKTIDELLKIYFYNPYTLNKININRKNLFEEIIKRTKITPIINFFDLFIINQDYIKITNELIRLIIDYYEVSNIYEFFILTKNDPIAYEISTKLLNFYKFNNKKVYKENSLVITDYNYFYYQYQIGESLIKVLDSNNKETYIDYKDVIISIIDNPY